MVGISPRSGSRLSQSYPRISAKRIPISISPSRYRLARAAINRGVKDTGSPIMPVRDVSRNCDSAGGLRDYARGIYENVVESAESSSSPSLTRGEHGDVGCERAGPGDNEIPERRLFRRPSGGCGRYPSRTPLKRGSGGCKVADAARLGITYAREILCRISHRRSRERISRLLICGNGRIGTKKRRDPSQRM